MARERQPSDPRHGVGAKGGSHQPPGRDVWELGEEGLDAMPLEPAPAYDAAVRTFLDLAAPQLLDLGSALQGPAPALADDPWHLEWEDWAPSPATAQGRLDALLEGPEAQAVRAVGEEPAALVLLAVVRLEQLGFGGPHFIGDPSPAWRTLAARFTFEDVGGLYRSERPLKTSERAARGIAWLRLLAASRAAP